VSVGGRPRIWLARISFPRNEARKTWDVYSWMVDVFPTIRGNEFIVLDRNCLTSFLLCLRKLDGDISNDIADSFQHSIVS